MTSCPVNFPFTQLCNGHGLCISQSFCACDPAYDQEFTDIFIEPVLVQCFTPMSALWWTWFVAFIITFAVTCRIAYIIALWLRYACVSEFVVYRMYVDVISRPSLQSILCKFGSATALTILLIMKLFSPTLMRIGVEWRATMLYSMVWNLVFADCLISLHSKLSVVNGVDARLTDHAPGELSPSRHCLEISSEASLWFINRAMLPMFYLGVACFSLGPATFLFDRTVKYNLAPFVFGLEGVLFCSFAATVYFVVLRKLCGELLQSMGFLQSQADAHSTVALEDKLQKYRTVYAVIWASGMKNVIQFSALGFFRFLIMVLPHWFTFFTLIEQIFFGITGAMAWSTFHTDIAQWDIAARPVTSVVLVSPIPARSNLNILPSAAVSGSLRSNRGVAGLVHALLPSLPRVMPAEYTWTPVASIVSPPVVVDTVN